MAVGLIVAAQQADAIIRGGGADLVAIGREALYDPNWAVHAQAELEAAPSSAPSPRGPTSPAGGSPGANRYSRSLECGK